MTKINLHDVMGDDFMEYQIQKLKDKNELPNDFKLSDDARKYLIGCAKSAPIPDNNPTDVGELEKVSVPLSMHVFGFLRGYYLGLKEK